MQPDQCPHLTWMFDHDLTCAHCGASMVRATKQETLDAYRTSIMNHVGWGEILGELSLGLPEAIEAAFAVRNK